MHRPSPVTTEEIKRKCWHYLSY